MVCAQKFRWRALRTEITNPPKPYTLFSNGKRCQMVLGSNFEDEVFDIFSNDGA